MIQGGSTEAESISRLDHLPRYWWQCQRRGHCAVHCATGCNRWGSWKVIQILMVCCEGLIWAGHTPWFLISQHGSLVKTCYCQMCFSQVIHPSLAVTGPVDTQPTLATSLGLCFLGTKSDVPWRVIRVSRAFGMQLCPNLRICIWSLTSRGMPSQRENLVWYVSKHRALFARQGGKIGGCPLRKSFYPNSQHHGKILVWFLTFFHSGDQSPCFGDLQAAPGATSILIQLDRQSKAKCTLAARSLPLSL